MGPHDLSGPAGSVGPVRLAGTPVFAFWTGSALGDQRRVTKGADPPGAVPAGKVVRWLDQVHGATVVDVSAPRPSPAPGDAALSADDSTCAAILVADCAPIAIGSPESVRVAVHAGWRGLVAGVVERSAVCARAAGASLLVAGIGPCIGPCCYEFSPSDLRDVADHVGPEVVSWTPEGRTALDLRAGVRRVLEASGVSVVFEDDSCTSCGTGWYSARRRRDVARQALYVWSDALACP